MPQSTQTNYYYNRNNRNIQDLIEPVKSYRKNKTHSKNSSYPMNSDALNCPFSTPRVRITPNLKENLSRSSSVHTYPHTRHPPNSHLHKRHNEIDQEGPTTYERFRYVTSESSKQSSIKVSSQETQRSSAQFTPSPCETKRKQKANLLDT